MPIPQGTHLYGLGIVTGYCSTVLFSIGYNIYEMGQENKKQEWAQTIRTELKAHAEAQQERLKSGEWAKDLKRKTDQAIWEANHNRAMQRSENILGTLKKVEEMLAQPQAGSGKLGSGKI